MSWCQIYRFTSAWKFRLRSGLYEGSIFSMQNSFISLVYRAQRRDGSSCWLAQTSVRYWNPESRLANLLSMFFRLQRSRLCVLSLADPRLLSVVSLQRIGWSMTRLVLPVSIWEAERFFLLYGAEPPYFLPSYSGSRVSGTSRLACHSDAESTANKSRLFIHNVKYLQLEQRPGCAEILAPRRERVGGKRGAWRWEVLF